MGGSGMNMQIANYIKKRLNVIFTRYLTKYINPFVKTVGKYKQTQKCTIDNQKPNPNILVD